MFLIRRTLKLLNMQANTDNSQLSNIHYKMWTLYQSRTYLVNKSKLNKFSKAKVFSTYWIIFNIHMWLASWQTALWTYTSQDSQRIEHWQSYMADLNLSILQHFSIRSPRFHTINYWLTYGIIRYIPHFTYYQIPLNQGVRVSYVKVSIQATYKMRKCECAKLTTYKMWKWNNAKAMRNHV